MWPHNYWSSNYWVPTYWPPTIGTVIFYPGVIRIFFSEVRDKIWVVDE